MGNENRPNWQEDYHVLQEFKNTKIIQEKTTHNRYDVVTFYPEASARSKESIFERIAARKSKQSSHIVPIARVERVIDPGYCGNKTRHDVVFQECSPSLKEMIDERRKRREKFEESEIEEVLRTVCLGLKDLREMDQNHNCVGVSTICVINNSVRLSDPITNRIVMHRAKCSLQGFPSPQKLYSQKDTQSLTEVSYADLFSVGMVGLQMHHIELDLHCLYVNSSTMSRYNLNLDRVAELLEMVQGQRTKKLIRVLLAEAGKERTGIYQMLTTNPGTVRSKQWIQKVTIPNHQTMVNSSSLESFHNTSWTLPPPTNSYFLHNSPVPPVVVSNSMPSWNSNLDYTPALTLSQNGHNLKLSDNYSKFSAQPLLPYSTTRANQIDFNNYQVGKSQQQGWKLDQKVVGSRPNQIEGLMTSQQIQQLLRKPPTTTQQPQIATYKEYQIRPNSEEDNKQSSGKSSASLSSIHSSRSPESSPSPVESSIKSNFSRSQVRLGANGDNILIMDRVSSQESQERVKTSKQPWSVNVVPDEQIQSEQIFDSWRRSSSGQDALSQQSNHNALDVVVQTRDDIAREALPDTPSANANLFHTFSQEGLFEGQPQAFTVLQDQFSSTEPIGLGQTVRSELPSAPSDRLQASQGDSSPQPGSKEPHSASFARRPNRLQKAYSAENRPVNVAVGDKVMDAQNTKNLVHVIQEDERGRFQGYKLNGKRHGKGQFRARSGQKYEGQWFNGLIQGQGSLFYSSGKLAYQGQWRQGKFNGRGRTFNYDPHKLQGQFDYTDFSKLGEEWLSYQGTFKDDVMHGEGTWELSNGEEYEGQFRNGLVHGKGRFVTLNGKAIDALWEKNHLKKYLGSSPMRKGKEKFAEVDAEFVERDECRSVELPEDAHIIEEVREDTQSERNEEATSIQL